MGGVHVRDTGSVTDAQHPQVQGVPADDTRVEPLPRTVEDLIALVRPVFGGGRVAEALALMEGADVLVGSDEDRLRLARLRAIVLSRAGRHEEALSALDGIADEWIARNGLMEAADIHALLAYLHHRGDDLEAALDAGAAALVMLHECSDQHHPMASSTHNTLGLMFRDLEATGLAIAEFTEALDLVSVAATGGNTTDAMLVQVVTANLASAHLRRAVEQLRLDRESEEARRQLGLAEAQARHLLAMTTLPRRQIEAVSILAAALLNAGRWREAGDLLDDHLHADELIDDPRALIDWHLLVSWATRERGRAADALVHADTAVRLAEESRDVIASSLALRERSRVHESLGDLDGALADLRSADDRARGLRSSRVEVLVEQLARRAQLEASRRRLQRETLVLADERARLAEAVETDPLTGVGNRRRFTASLSVLRRGPTRQVSALAVDVDRFKAINDRYGHPVGDQVLGVLTTLMGVYARDRDIICRLGGDEFIVLLPGARPEDASGIAERLRHGVSAHDWTEVGVGDEVTVSIGVASGGSASVVEIVADADEALLSAKRRGRNRVEIARPLAGDGPH